ncbi:MAG: rod shape-determining protein [Verrucomicrobiota bacterium]
MSTPVKSNRTTEETEIKSAPKSGDEPQREAKQVLQLGFDWGTNTSCIQGSLRGSTELTVHHLVPTVVGYAKEGILPDLLPGNASVLFGQEALKHRLHLRLVQPMIDGVLKDISVSRDYLQYLKSLISVPAGTEIRAVIGIPANAAVTARENVRQVVAGIFDRVILIPEPFLAALGFRGENRLTDPNYVDPVRNSLFVDIGAGTTDVCLVQGYYPTAEDQISLPFAGDKVDAILSEGIKKTYPDCGLSTIKVREIKEQHSSVVAAEQPVIVNVMVGGKVRKLDLTEQIDFACRSLLNQVFEATKALIARAPSDSITELLQNIILTGGGSQIRQLDSELQRMLVEEGYEKPIVRSVGKNYKDFVAKGALKAARQAREDQWQHLLRGQS